MSHTPLNTLLREEARSYGLDPIKYASDAELEKDVISQRAMRQSVHAPQQPDVDSGNAKVAAQPGAVGEQIKMKENVKPNAVQSASQTKRSSRQPR